MLLTELARRPPECGSAVLLTEEMLSLRCVDTTMAVSTALMLSALDELAVFGESASRSAGVPRAHSSPSTAVASASSNSLSESPPPPRSMSSGRENERRRRRAAAPLESRGCCSATGRPRSARMSPWLRCVTDGPSPSRPAAAAPCLLAASTPSSVESGSSPCIGSSTLRRSATVTRPSRSTSSRSNRAMAEAELGTSMGKSATSMARTNSVVGAERPPPMGVGRVVPDFGLGLHRLGAWSELPEAVRLLTIVHLGHQSLIPNVSRHYPDQSVLRLASLRLAGLFPTLRTLLRPQHTDNC